MDIRVDQVRYHRNGVGGEGFYAVAFRHRNGRKFVPMLATVFDTLGQVAVLDPAAGVGFAWRGDHFETALREAVAEWDADGRAYLDRTG